MGIYIVYTVHMNTAVINIKTNPKTKKEAQEVAEALGLSLSAVINGFLTHMIKTKTVVFSDSEEPSEYLIKALEQSKKDIKEGWVSPTFDSIEDEVKWLNDPNAKYIRQLRKKV